MVRAKLKGPRPERGREQARHLRVRALRKLLEEERQRYREQLQQHQEEERARRQEALQEPQRALQEELSKLAWQLQAARDEGQAGLEEVLKGLQAAPLELRRVLTQAVSECRARQEEAARQLLALQRAVAEERAAHAEQLRAMALEDARARAERETKHKEERALHVAVRFAVSEERAQHTKEIASLQKAKVWLQKWQREKEVESAQLRQRCQELQAANDSLERRLEALQSERERAEKEKEGLLVELRKDQVMLTRYQAKMRENRGKMQAALETERACQERWRHCQYEPQSWTVDDHSLPKILAELLRNTSHTHQDGSRCNGMQALYVTRVEKICNSSLWDKYMRSLKAMMDFHVKHGVNPHMLNLPGGLEEHFPWMTLSKAQNETLLWHGCAGDTANLIKEEGFDPRASNPGGLYGEGTYFASQGCKSWQYTSPDDRGWRCILLCRVLLGDPEIVSGSRKGEKRPSLRNSENRQRGTFDSFVVNPGASGGPNGQVHREFVIFKGEQAYPELAVWFTT